LATFWTTIEFDPSCEVTMNRLAALTSILLLLGAIRADEASDAVARELKKLQGTWSTAALTYNGKDFLADGKSGFNFVFKGDEAAIEGNDKVKKEYAKIKVKIDLTVTPKIMDISVIGGVQKDAVIEGIYELKGDELKICARVFGKDRPTEFVAPGGSSIVLLVLKREK
jgi:uncharacterized protein (TIGR03067 family)